MELTKSLVILLCLPLVAALPGCNNKPASSGAAAPAGSNEKPEKKEAQIFPPRPLLKGWEKPAVAMILSGEQNGYLEPCGCSETQSGGMARRADLFEQLRKKGWPVTGFDAGGLLRRARRQSRLKFDAILDSLNDLGYTATGLGPSEISLGFEKIVERGQMEPEEPGAQLNQFVSANVTLFNDPDFGAIKRTKIVEINGIKIGVTSLIGETVQRNMLKTRNEEIQVLPVAETLPLAVAELKAAGTDLNILLSFAETEESQKLGEQFPLFDVVLTARSAEDPDPRAIPLGDEGRIMVKVGQKGKNVGVLGYYPEAKQKLRWELVDLDNRRFKNHPGMSVHMKSYQENLIFEELAKSEPALTHPDGRTFVGAKRCNLCHPKAYKVWADSKHAHAFETLQKGRKGQEADWIPRSFDPECLSCHVTGWEPQENLRFDSGFISEVETPQLRGQQCENCHGPGSEHTDLEGRWQQDRKSIEKSVVMAGRARMHLDKKTAETRVCSQCHDHENSPKFKFDEYWKKIEHPFRD